MKLDPKAQALLDKANAQRALRVPAFPEEKEEKVKEEVKNVPETQEVLEVQDPEYPFTLKIRNKTFHYRGWKVKDIRNYRAATDSRAQRQALVFNCLKEGDALDTQEFLYALISIRSKSFSDKTQYAFKCDNPECGKVYSHEIFVQDVVKTSFADYTPFKVGEHAYEFQDIQNRDFYETQDKSELFDLVMHIKSIDDNNALTVEEVLHFIDDLPVQEYRDLKKKFDEQKFSMTLEEDITCPHCGKKDHMIYDMIPNLIPDEFEE